MASISDIKKNPAEFLYIFASDLFLSKIDSKSAEIIRGKRTRQAKILKVASVDAGIRYEDLVKDLNDLLKENFGHTGTEILKILAEGGTVAGKDWSKGVYGIGKTTYEGFTGTNITVDPTTGKIMQGGVEVSGQTAVYGNKATTYTANIDGVVYTSQYNKSGIFSAGTFTNAEGKVFDPMGGAAGLGAFDNIWSSIESFMPMFENLLNWLKSMFSSMFEGTELITKKNTVPSQKDGFVQNSGIDVATVGVAAGIAALVFWLTGRKKSKKK